MTPSRRVFNRRRDRRATKIADMKNAGPGFLPAPAREPLDRRAVLPDRGRGQARARSVQENQRRRAPFGKARRIGFGDPKWRERRRRRDC